MHSIRKFVGRGTIALALAALVALAVAVQSGQAARSSSASARQGAVVTSALLNDTQADLARQTVAEATPSPACIAAVNAVKAALAGDRTEDTLEAANGTPDTETGAEQTEDANEAAALKPLFAAVATACGPFIGEKQETEKHSTPPTAQCAAAVQALKAAFAQQRAEAQAEFTSGTEGTAADATQDQAAKAQIVSLFSAVKAACGTSFFDWDHR